MAWPKKLPSCPRERAVWPLWPETLSARVRTHEARPSPAPPSGTCVPSQPVLPSPAPPGVRPCSRSCPLPSCRASTGRGVAAETAAALASWDPGSLNQKLKTFSRILLLCNGSRTFHLLPFFLLRGLCLPPLKAFHRGSLKPVCQGLPQRGQEVGGSLREASVFHRCSQNPQDSCAGPLKCGLPSSFTEPLSSHQNRPFPGVLATSGTSQDPCGDTCSSTPGKPRPQTWESPQRTMPPHGAGIGHEEACSDATLTSSQRTGGKESGQAGRPDGFCPPRVSPKPGARHTASSPERSMLVGLGSNPRSSPLLLRELWPGEFTSLSS